MASTARHNSLADQPNIASCEELAAAVAKAKPARSDRTANPPSLPRPWYALPEAKAILRGFVGNAPETVRQVKVYVTTRDEFQTYTGPEVERLWEIRQAHVAKVLLLSNLSVDRELAKQIFGAGGAGVSVENAIDSVKADGFGPVEWWTPLVEIDLSEKRAAA